MSRTVHLLGKIWGSLKSNAINSRPYHNFRFYESILLPSSNSSLSVLSPHVSVRGLSESSYGRQQDDRIKLFMDPEVQKLLVNLTGRDLKRIFRKKKTGQKIKEPKYTFMTEDQLRKARDEAENRADELLRMPPVLKPRDPIDEILSFDPCIQGEERATLVFTDITMNVSDRDRIIVARDPDGTLRQATWQERDKMNAIYFPVQGREFATPIMFSDSTVLKEILSRACEEDNTYEFILDRACLQFEPDNELYVSTVETVYDAVDARDHYHFLKSTRHFGPMVFYLVRTRKLDGLLLHFIKNERVSTDATDLIQLFHIMFPDCKSKLTGQASNDVDRIRQYIKLDAIKRIDLELSLDAYEENEKQKHELESGLHRQHGMRISS